MSSIQSRNLFLFVGFLYRLLGNGIWPVRGVLYAVVQFNLSDAMETIM